MRLSYLKISKLVGFDSTTQKGVFETENAVEVYRSVKTQNIAINEKTANGEMVKLVKTEDFYIDNDFANVIATDIANYFIEKLPEKQRNEVAGIVLEALENACIVERSKH